MISSIRDPIGRGIEKQTKRIQYWKAFFEVTSLTETDAHFSDHPKNLCRQDLEESYSEIQKLTNPFVDHITKCLTVIGMLLIVAILYPNDDFPIGSI